MSPYIEAGVSFTAMTLYILLGKAAENLIGNLIVIYKGTFLVRITRVKFVMFFFGKLFWEIRRV